MCQGEVRGYEESDKHTADEHRRLVEAVSTPSASGRGAAVSETVEEVENRGHPS